VSLDTSVTFVIGYVLEDRGSISGTGNGFSLRDHLQNGSGPNQPRMQWFQVYISSRFKWPERQADYSLSSNEGNKTLGALPPSPYTTSWSNA
jgi:hypothetical protein